MNLKATLQAVLHLVLLVVAVSATAGEPVYPVKVSANGRYIVDQRGDPVFWLGTTQWQLFREYKLEEARLILDKSKDKGFVFLQVMLMGVGDGTKTNVYGHKPWIDNNPLTPNEEYFQNVDAVMQAVRERNLIISMTLYHQRYRKYITLDNARAWAKWLAQRYKEMPNIVWSMTPEAKQEFVPVVRELAVGLHEGDGGAHLITFKPDPAPYSSSFVHGESWLDFDSMQTWKSVELIYPMVANDYNLKPVKPVLMAEGAYEAGTEYSFDVTPLWVRRQAYYSYLAGAVHAYGHNANWRLLPIWKEALDAPGAVQMGVLKDIFTARKEWWLMVPDQSVLASGGDLVPVALPKYDASEKERTAYVRGLKPSMANGEATGDLLHLAARHEGGKWAMIYLADHASFSVNMNKISSPKVNMFWVDPRTGRATPTGQEPNTGVKSFTTPDDWEDSLLVLEAAE
jgi:hypothetical protein